jgi:hypothetical protein
MVSTAGADAAGADDTLTVMPTGDRETLPFDHYDRARAVAESWTAINRCL